MTTAIANVKTSLDAAETSASPVLQPSVQQVKTAFGELQAAASGVTADNLRQKRRLSRQQSKRSPQRHRRSPRR